MLALAVMPAEGANWFKLRGTQPGKAPPTLRVFGFVQPTYVNDRSDDIEGAVGALASRNGTRQVPGTIPPDRKERRDLFLRRARLGARGKLNPVSPDIDYFVLTEWGHNGVTRGGETVQLLDASMTFSQLSRGVDSRGLQNLGVRLRAGQFLFSQTSEALSHSTPGRRIHVFMPEATFQLALRRLASDNGRHNFPEDKVPVNAARDFGVELFDWVEFASGGEGPWEFTYSAALGAGDTIGEYDRDNNLRSYYWLSFARLFDKTRGPRRHDAMVYGWYQQGDIEFNPDINNDGIPDNQVGPGGNLNPGDLSVGPQSPGNKVVENGNEDDFEQKYWGMGIEYFNRPFEKLGQIRFEAEYQKQDGLIFDGPQSPSSAAHRDVGGFESILYDLDGKSEGWYVDAGYDIQHHLGLSRRTTLNLRYDEFDRNKGNELREANWKTWTLTGEYFIHKQTRLAISWQWRDVSADNRTGVARTNGNAVLEQVDQRIGIQLTAVFSDLFSR